MTDDSAKPDSGIRITLGPIASKMATEFAGDQKVTKTNFDDAILSLQTQSSATQMGPLATKIAQKYTEGEPAGWRHLELALHSLLTQKSAPRVPDYTPLLDDLAASLVHLRYMVMASVSPSDEEQMAALEIGIQKADQRLMKAADSAGIQIQKTRELQTLLRHRHEENAHVVQPEEREYEPEAER